MESLAEDRAAGQPEVPPSQAAQLTLQALRQRIRDYDTPRARDRLTNAVVRGACAGLALRGSLHLVSLLASMAVSRRRQRRGVRPGTAAAAAAAAAARQVSPSNLQRVVETLRYGAFFGAFSGVYVAADELIAMLVGRKKCAWEGRGVLGFGGCLGMEWQGRRTASRARRAGPASCCVCFQAPGSLHPRKHTKEGGRKGEGKGRRGRASNVSRRLPSPNPTDAQANHSGGTNSSPPIPGLGHGGRWWRACWRGRPFG